MNQSKADSGILKINKLNKKCQSSARLVVAQETESNRRWAESKIKAMTGGDPISARFMRGDFFTYSPAFKLFIAGNHKPGLSNVDEAMRRRLQLIPFTVTIPKEERDPDLQTKLRSEWPGILQWAIDGCLEWQKIGLAPPSAVTAATSEYFDEEDAFGNWLAECCVTGKSYQSSNGDLFRSWSVWAASAGEQVGTQASLTKAIGARGFASKRITNKIRGFTGIQAAIPVHDSHRYDV